MYGTTHIGNNIGWDDQFVINMNNLVNDDLDLVAFIDDVEVGRGKLSVMEMIRNSNVMGGNTFPYLAESIPIKNRQGDIVGQLSVDTIQSRK